MAVAVLTASALLLSQIASFCRLNLEKLQYRTQAQLLCQSKLSEIVCGAQPLEAITRQEFSDLPGWFFSVQLNPLESEGLVAVVVTVWLEADSAATAGEGSARRLAEFSLARWIRDPNRPALTQWNSMSWDLPGGSNRSTQRRISPSAPRGDGDGSPSSSTARPRRSMGFGGWRRFGSRGQ